MKMDTRVRSSTEQILTLLKFMETHGDLARPLTGAQGRLRSERLWAELTNILNAVGGGVIKTEEKWKKVWADWKSKTKKKALILRRHAKDTGSGPARCQSLTEVDKRVLAIMGPLAVEGQTSVEDLEFNKPQSSAPSQSPPPAAEDNLPLHLEILYEPAEVPLDPPSTQGRVTASPAPTSPPRRRRIPNAAATSPPTRHRLLSTTTATPQSATSSRHRLRTRFRRVSTSFERVASQYAAIKLRRLELEETRARQQHEREMRALDIENDRNQLYRDIVNIAQTWLDYYRSRDNK